MTLSDKPHATVDDVQILEFRGPWQAKSGGELDVLFALPYDVLQSKYFHYDDEELKDIPEDVRGLRAYRVRNLEAGKIGANEWHRLRHELVFAAVGSIRWTCEDLYGNKKEFVLNQNQGVWTPPFVLHTYEALEDNSCVQVIANTLFNPEDPRTHDTFSADKFHELQKAYLKQD